MFNANGVSKLTAEVGQKLDPNQHEAMFDVPNPDAEPGTIAVIVKVSAPCNLRCHLISPLWCFVRCFLASCIVPCSRLIFVLFSVFHYI